jgi:hypothetical protein
VRKGDLKFLKILILRIRSIITKPKMKMSKKKVGEDLMNGRGSSFGLKVSRSGQRLLRSMRERIRPTKRGVSNVILLGEKLGMIEEI